MNSYFDLEASSIGPRSPCESLFSSLSCEWGEDKEASFISVKPSFHREPSPELLKRDWNDLLIIQKLLVFVSMRQRTIQSQYRRYPQYGSRYLKFSG